MSDALKQNEINTELQKLFEARFKPVFEALRTRTRNMTELHADNLADDIEVPGVAPYLVRKLVLDFFKALEDLKLGRLLVGRRGKSTRFVWSVPMLEVAAAAVGAGQVTMPPSNGSATETLRQTPARSEMVSFQFVLRSGLVVRFDLPHDFSQTEADRLCKFIQALPLAHHSKP